MVPPWHYPVSQSCGIESSSSFEQAASVSLDRGLNVAVIVTNAKRKARVMVDIALQVLHLHLFLVYFISCKSRLLSA